MADEKQGALDVLQALLAGCDRFEDEFGLGEAYWGPAGYVRPFDEQLFTEARKRATAALLELDAAPELVAAIRELVVACDVFFNSLSDSDVGKAFIRPEREREWNAARAKARLLAPASSEGARERVEANRKPANRDEVDDAEWSFSDAAIEVTREERLRMKRLTVPAGAHFVQWWERIPPTPPGVLRLYNWGPDGDPRKK